MVETLEAEPQIEEETRDGQAVEAVAEERESVVMRFKRRMLEWPNPVEYVNNMYGCHPHLNREYFEAVFG
jgi:hypothetical protein